MVKPHLHMNELSKVKTSITPSVYKKQWHTRLNEFLSSRQDHSGGPVPELHRVPFSFIAHET